MYVRYCCILKGIPKIKKHKGQIVIMNKPHINYPCVWLYKIIGRDETSLKKAALDVVQGTTHTISPSNSSSSGKYHSLNVEVHVCNEEERIDIFEQLKKAPSIVYIL